MEALIADSPIVPGLLTEYILKGKNRSCHNTVNLKYCIKGWLGCWWWWGGGGGGREHAGENLTSVRCKQIRKVC